MVFWNAVYIGPTECILKLFRCRVATPFYYFLHQTVWQYSDRDPFTGASNARGMEKSRFSTNILFISAIMQDKAIASECYQFP